MLTAGWRSAVRGTRRANTSPNPPVSNATQRALQRAEQLVVDAVAAAVEDHGPHRRGPVARALAHVGQRRRRRPSSS